MFVFLLVVFFDYGGVVDYYWGLLFLRFKGVKYGREVLEYCFLVICLF